MATQNVESNECVFDRIILEIVTVFALIIEQTKKRRDQLITQLNELRIQHHEKLSQIPGLKELEQMRTQIMKISIKENSLLKVQEASLAPIVKQINDLKEKSVSEPLLRFECPLTEMLDKMETLGAIMDEQVNVNVKPSNEQRIDYSKRILAKRTIGKKGKGNGEFLYPSKMHISNSGQLYVIDRDNRRVQVFDAESGNFLLQFGRPQFSNPNGVTTNNTFCYVTDVNENKIFQFSIKDYSLVRETTRAGGSFKNLNNPAGIAMSEEDLMYVTDYGNNRVYVYDATLNYVDELGVGMLRYPRDVKIYCNEIYILDQGFHCLHIFTKFGIKQCSMLHSGEYEAISTASSFTIDADWNIIVSDIDSQALKIFSIKGKLLHSIDREDCFGVVLFRGNLFLSCREPSHCIKLF